MSEFYGTEISDWQERVRCHEEDLDSVYRDYHQMQKWFRGDFTDMDNKFDAEDIYRVNMIQLTAKSLRANVFFNNPEYIVEPAKGISAERALVETRTLNDTMRESALYQHGRMVILDAILGPFGCFRVGYNADIAVDEEAMEKDRDRSYRENMALVTGLRISVRDTDNDTQHIAIHDQLIEQIGRGDIEVNEGQLNRLMAHQTKHRQQLQKKGGRPLEHVRAEKAFVERIRPDMLSWDQWTADFMTSDWFCVSRLRPLHQIHHDRSFGKNRKDAPAINFSDYKVLKTGIAHKVQKSSIPYGLQREVLDLAHNKIITYACGMEKPLREVEYVLSDIMPSGNFEFLRFVEDPCDAHGVAPMGQIKDQQRLINVLSTVEAEVAKRQIPKMGVSASKVSPEELERIRKGDITEHIVFDDIEDGDKVENHIFRIPAPGLTQEIVGIGNKAMELTSKLSGMGEVRLGGGDRSKTATASDMLNEAVQTMTSELGILLNHTMVGLGKKTLRIIRRLYDPATVARSAGPDAMNPEIWPEVWSATEILDDRGVKIVAGTMRRETTEIRMRTLTELYSVMGADPNIPPMVKMQFLNHILNLSEAPFDLTEFIREAGQQQQPTGPVPGPGMQAGAPPPGAGGQGQLQLADLRSQTQRTA